MNKKNTILAFLLAIWVIAAFADDANVSIAPIEQWSNVFGGKESVFHFAVSADKVVQGRLGWHFSTSGRTIVRGEAQVAVEPGQPETVEIRLRVPEVKAGVIMQALLSVSVLGTREATSGCEKEIWIYPEDAFAIRKEWLKKLKIRLFDPEKKTAEQFENAEIPFEAARNIDSFTEITNGIVVIGEGISFKEYHGLSDMMVKTAARGIPVLCLAPAAGDMTIPGMGDSDLPVPTSMLFRQNEIITELDKRLDADAWPPDGKVKVSSIMLKGEKGPVIGEMQEGGNKWPWIELKFGEKGRFIFCGFGIIKKWASGPTPRFLFVKLLEYIHGKQSEVSSQ